MILPDDNRSSWKQFGKASERRIKDLICRLKIARRVATADDLHSWIEASSDDRVTRVLKSILFADLPRFQHLSPSKHVAFHRKLERIFFWALHASGGRPLFANTWGDGLHVIFDSPLEAAAFSLAWIDASKKVDWRGFGLSADTNFRVGIHYGYVQMHKNSIIGRQIFVGASITHAARLEPAAIPGQVLTSKAFADILNTSTDGRFECVFIGERYLSKTEQKYPAFRLHRKDPDLPAATS